MAATVASRRDCVLFTFLWGTGACLGSALALEVGDVDLAAGTTTLHELKGGGSMTAYLRPELVELLTAAVGDRRSDRVFASLDGKPCVLLTRKAREDHDYKFAAAALEEIEAAAPSLQPCLAGAAMSFLHAESSPASTVFTRATALRHG